MTLPDRRAEARKLQHKTIWYILLRDILFKKSYSNLHPHPYLRCLGLKEEARKVMQKIHDGDCGDHAGELSLAYKVIIREYY